MRQKLLSPPLSAQIIEGFVVSGCQIAAVRLKNRISSTTGDAKSAPIIKNVKNISNFASFGRLVFVLNSNIDKVVTLTYDHSSGAGISHSSYDRRESTSNFRCDGNQRELEGKKFVPAGRTAGGNMIRVAARKNAFQRVVAADIPFNRTMIVLF